MANAWIKSAVNSLKTVSINKLHCQSKKAAEKRLFLLIFKVFFNAVRPVTHIAVAGRPALVPVVAGRYCVVLNAVAVPALFWCSGRW